MIVGIDLGTTNTTCSVVDPRGDRPFATPVRVPIRQLVRDPSERDAFDTELVLPSVVWLRDDACVFTGQYPNLASSDIDLRQGRVVTNIKRQMGNPAWQVQLANTTLRPRHVSAFLLASVRASVTAMFPSHSITRVVITIPASFSSLMRQETLRSAAIAGFDPTSVELLDEPVAAALSQLSADDGWVGTVVDGAPVLVVDMGGGTLDASVIRVSSATKRIEIISTSRYHDFAGSDIDLELASAALRHVRLTGEYNKFLEVDDSLEPQEQELLGRRIGQGLLAVGENLKVSLSQVLESDHQLGGITATVAHFDETRQAIEIDWTMEFGHSITPHRCAIPISVLVRCIQPFVTDRGGSERNIFVPIQQALKRATLKRPATILLAGGSSYLPIVRDAVAGFFLQKPHLLDPVHAVSDGAAVWGYLKDSGSWEIAETLRDGLYLKRKGHSFVQVFSHPSPVPSTIQERIFSDEESPTFSAQRNVRLEFFQGDSPYDPLLSICHVESIELPRDPAGDLAVIRVEASVDANKVFAFRVVFRDGSGAFDKSFTFEPAHGRISGIDAPRELEMWRLNGGPNESCR